MNRSPSTSPPRIVGRRTANDGFTLVEILIAIVLVGILSAVVVVGIGTLTEKGSSAACAASLDAAKAGSIVYRTAGNDYPTTMLQMTSATPPSLTLSAGVTLNTATVAGNSPGTVATGRGWTLTMAAGAAGAAPIFVCSPAATSGATAGTTACPGSFTGWVGEYYPNVSLGGTPTLCRDDSSIDFNWAGSSPGAGLAADYFSVRWTRGPTFVGGPHTFTVGSDDGSRLYIDGVLVIDFWTDHSYATSAVTRTLAAGSHTVVLEFYERAGDAVARLSWT